MTNNALGGQANSRLLITLVLDTSGSMKGNRIAQLNKFLSELKQALDKDKYINRVGEVAIVTFGNDGVRAITGTSATSHFVAVNAFTAPSLESGGFTPMTKALRLALSLVTRRKAELRTSGIPMAHRPLIFLVTDGLPTDDQGNLSADWREVAAELRRQESGKHLHIFSFGVADADAAVLQGLAPKSTYQIDDVDFSAVLQLMSISLELARSASNDGDADELYESVRKRNEVRKAMQKFLQGDK
ncbi:hypothetical protein CS0771_41310 [Catellatospora sp. IY07-71]|uniref:vWA domain-containing protein n=1 Tax=Catellatospora sp. IY07-71 TaxID=2728827 RepID=UPI001BB3EA13|nr:VWA domain-containing protein [Catellatospora sp. IY07-71]BCJ74587.1 hypothetical protein CS0771_41310 [Catellatospora sp. IY07-71]